jgi:hypothetical protein
MKRLRLAADFKGASSTFHWHSVLPLFTLCLLVLPSVMACTSTSMAPSKDELLFGTWVDKELIGSQLECKFVYQPDGRSFAWHHGRLPEQPNNVEGRFTIEKKWRDSQGNTWYRVAAATCLVPYMDSKATKTYGLVEVHPDGRTLEGEWSTVGFPSEFGALGNYHYVYHREE